MALRHFDGFDYYVGADLTSQYNIVGAAWQITASVGRFSSGALTHITTGGGELLAKFFDDQPTWVVGVAYRFNLGGFPNIIISVEDGGLAQVELRMNSSNILVVTRNGTVIGTGTNPLLTDTFYFLEFKVTVGTSISAHTCKVRIGGVDEIDVAAATNTDAQASGKANRVVLHYDNFHMLNKFDDYYVLDGTGPANNDFLGDMRVETNLPSSQGHYADFTAVGAGTHYGAVNDAAEDGDATYVHSSTVGNKETYIFPSLSSVPTAVAGVKLTTVCRKDDAGTRALKPMFRIATTDYLGAQQPMTDSYIFSSTIYEANPATSLAWTGSDVDGAEAGFDLSQ